MKLSINAWTGQTQDAPSSEIGSGALAWALRSAGREGHKTLAPPAEPDWNDWRDEGVGWGVVVPTLGGFSNAERAAGKDIEDDDALQTLLDSRRQAQPNVPVLHYAAGATPGHGQVFLRNYRAGKDLDMVSDIGLADDRLPYYLLIWGGPRVIPWSLQYTLQERHAVGRLDPEMEGVQNYVDALIDGWDGAESSPNRTVTWAVDHGPHDITRLMRNVVAKRIHDDLAGDADVEQAVFLDGTTHPAEATGAALVQHLAAIRPGVVVSSSHGKTGPLDQPEKLLDSLGIPVDQNHADLDVDRLLEAWQPDGAVWFAQACCSAGSMSPSHYAGLFASDSAIGSILEGVAAAGSSIAPLPRRLLGCEKPARGFFGQVEPTFNLTLQQPETKQSLTGPLRFAFYNRLLRPEPTGRILRGYYEGAGVKYRQARELNHLFEQGQEVTDKLLYVRASAIDIDSLVLIGDPTALLPPL